MCHLRHGFSTVAEHGSDLGASGLVGKACEVSCFFCGVFLDRHFFHQGKKTQPGNMEKKIMRRFQPSETISTSFREGENFCNKVVRGNREVGEGKIW